MWGALIAFFIFIIFCAIFMVVFFNTILPSIKIRKEEQEKENLILFKVLYSQNIYSIWNTNTESFLTLKTLVDGEESTFIGIFDNLQSIYSLFDRSTNPWKSSYKVVKIARNNLIAEKIQPLQINYININGRMFMQIEKFTLAEINFYKSIIEGRISPNGLVIGDEIYNTIEGDYFYIECH